MRWLMRQHQALRPFNAKWISLCREVMELLYEWSALLKMWQEKMTQSYTGKRRRGMCVSRHHCSFCSLTNSYYSDFSFSPSQLKSILQKNVRLCNPVSAVKAALELIRKALVLSSQSPFPSPNLSCPSHPQVLTLSFLYPIFATGGSWSLSVVSASSFWKMLFFTQRSH